MTLVKQEVLGLEQNPNLLLETERCLVDPSGKDSAAFFSLARCFGDERPFNKEQVYFDAIQEYFRNPTMPAILLAQKLAISRDDIIAVHHWMQNSSLIRDLFTSPYYPRYFLIRYAGHFLRGLTERPCYLNRVLAKEPIAPDRIELHVTNARCNYNCAMCLWRVGGKAKYIETETHRPLVNGEIWTKFIKQARELGVKTLIFSGGGEPLLPPNKEKLTKVLKKANKLGFFTMIYTNGRYLIEADDNSSFLEAILSSSWLRVSLHAATNETNAALTGLAEKREDFWKVLEGIEKLKTRRFQVKSKLKIGIGFVVQHQNFQEIEAMAALASRLGVDFLNFRVDCIDITQRLTAGQEERLNSALRRVREGLKTGVYGRLKIDFADILIEKMDGWTGKLSMSSPIVCRVHFYRPAINPYGRYAVCDLMAEPGFSSDEFTLGYITDGSYDQLLLDNAKREFLADCPHCMPGQQSINALWEKVIKDASYDIYPQDQPYLFS